MYDACSDPYALPCLLQRKLADELKDLRSKLKEKARDDDERAGLADPSRSTSQRARSKEYVDFERQEAELQQSLLRLELENKQYQDALKKARPCSPFAATCTRGSMRAQQGCLHCVFDT
jgi:uncharacterized membrane protein YgaE (UPF0421/DUF939 family)